MPNDNVALPVPQQPTLLREIGDALRPHGDNALRGTDADTAARAWLEAGFTDADDVGDWLGARCFDPRQAASLEALGFTPEQAARRTRAGSTDYEETIAFKLSRGDLSLEEARRIITSDFWNS